MQLSGASKTSTATHTVEGSAIVIEDCSDDEEAERKPCPCLVAVSHCPARAWTPATPPLPAPFRKAANAWQG